MTFLWLHVILGASRRDEAEGMADLWVCTLKFPTSCVHNLFAVPREGARSLVQRLRWRRGCGFGGLVRALNATQAEELS